MATIFEKCNYKHLLLTFFYGRENQCATIDPYRNKNRVWRRSDYDTF